MRIRHLQGAFRTKTGRNAPAGRDWLFAQPKWTRSFIKPPPGHALYQRDYVGQESEVAALLSGDRAMLKDCRGGDLYINFAIRSGAAPSWATKESHSEVRRVYKTVFLGLLYGMGAKTLARRLGISVAEAKAIIAAHRKAYPRFWPWQEEVLDEAILNGRIRSPLGWQLRLGPSTKATTIGNFPMQAAGGDMLRVALCLAGDAGLSIVGLVHDALVGLAPIEQVEEHCDLLGRAMGDASEVVLGPGNRLRTSSEIVRWPDRMSPESGREMWELIYNAALEAEKEDDFGKEER